MTFHFRTTINFNSYWNNVEGRIVPKALVLTSSDSFKVQHGFVEITIGNVNGDHKSTTISFVALGHIECIVTERIDDD